MGMLEKIFVKWARARIGGGLESISGSGAKFHAWNGQLYENELIRAAVDARARNVAKLQITVTGSAKPRLRTAIKNGPNEWTTWGQFLYRLSTILDIQNSAFIAPLLDENGEIIGYYPLLPSRCETVEAEGTTFLRYLFSDGKMAAVEMGRCGIMTQRQYADDIFGEDNDALRSTMDMITIQQQGIMAGIKNSASFRFMARKNNFADIGDIKKEQKRFNAEALQSDSDGGVLIFPNTFDEVKQIVSRPVTVDTAQQEMIRTNVCNYFGVSMEVLQNKAGGDAWAAFYEGAIEPFAIQLSDVMSRMTFSGNERARGAGIFATANRLQYMSNADKLSVSAQMADRGIMNRDEIREIWNLPPLPDGQGQAYLMRGEYKNAAEEASQKTGTEDENNA